ncbi:hypothetical protein [Salipaludibacillus aurantiacus]|uniref:Uncharacterized protein n=1 Tax=Salipaludibacillus aurantiacus TaxID=1601833 RepID=A0A1H9VBS7_9BACI|nr:hypothetical protein [Salipaludibacillus aurantiacus]SES18894.1 hypothetical protein SAMN05518684_11052 [Salipaludibacillus aurantiacus]
MSLPFSEEAVAEALTEKFYEQDGAELEKFGDRGRKHTKEDLLHHFNYLNTAYELENEQIFVDYALWLHQVLVTRGVPEEMLLKSFAWIDEELERYEEDKRMAFYQKCLRLANDALR